MPFRFRFLTMNIHVIVVFSALVFVASPFPTAWAEEDAYSTLWKYSPMLTRSREVAKPGYVVPRVYSPYATSSPDFSALETLDQPDAETRAKEYARATAGSHLDPLFDLESPPSLRPQSINKPMIDRPTYDYPGYNAPLYNVEPVTRVAIDRPLYVAPIVDPPRYTVGYTQGPGAVAPTAARTPYLGPNYDRKPIDPPAYVPPTIDPSGIGYHPEAYTGPVYTPSEYPQQKTLPPQYMPPHE
jgi:hypothetical protein